MSLESVKFSERHIPQGQGGVYARDYEGAGPAFVLLHGFPDNLHIYDRLIHSWSPLGDESSRSIFSVTALPTNRRTRNMVPLRTEPVAGFPVYGPPVG
jgi:hypothetical protein